MHSGKCECNALAYQFNGEPLTCYTCHCTDCQTSSGSAFGLSMIVNEKDLDVIHGKLSINTIDYSGTIVKKHFCKKCCTVLWLSSKEYPGIVALKPGTFDDTKWFRPIAHLWTRSAQPWVSFDATIPEYRKQPEFSELMRLWETQSD